MAADISNQQASSSSYTTCYRLAKTVFMVFAWISFGMNMDIVSPSLEDLKILLQINYQDIAFGLVLRSIGQMVVTTFIGLVFDKLSGHTELIMAFTKIMMISSKIENIIYSALSVRDFYNDLSKHFDPMDQNLLVDNGPFSFAWNVLCHL
jgi:hypothetical protein